MRVVEPDLGLVTHSQAMILADEQDADLIEISTSGGASICVIMELGKWKYLQEKKAKASKQVVLEVKQVQIRPVTEHHDLEVKAKQVRGFLEAGHKVRMVVRLHGRELVHETEAQAALDKLIELSDCSVEQRSGLENKQIVALVTKRKG